MQFQTSAQDVFKVKSGIEKMGFTVADYSIDFIPVEEVTLDDLTVGQVQKSIAKFEDVDGVQNIVTNIKNLWNIFH